MNTYGFHGIHGRAPAIASGLKVARPDLSVWVMTGDGDGLSIGGNHFLHTLRRNVDLKVLLFNNRIYGLTKGQYSPTSVKGTKTPTSPYGSLENPVHPISVALAAEATFVARSVDILGAHLREVIARAARHRGSAFIEILQNCVIFNDGAFRDVTGPKNRADRLLTLKDGEPLVFGRDRDKGIRLNGVKPEVVKVGPDGVSEDELLRHNEKSEDPFLAFLLAQLRRPGFPLPVGVFREVNRRATRRRSTGRSRRRARRSSPAAWTMCCARARSGKCRRRRKGKRSQSWAKGTRKNWTGTWAPPAARRGASTTRRFWCRFAISAIVPPRCVSHRKPPWGKP